MKRYFLLLLLSVLSIAGYAQKDIALIQHTQKPLTDRDRKNYILSIDQDKIGIMGSAPVWYHERYGFITMSVTLTNNSADTLNYCSTTCVWVDIFTTNNPNVQTIQWPCDKDLPAIETVLPYTSKAIKVPLLFDKKPEISTYKFRVGIYLSKTGRLEPPHFFPTDVSPNEHLIWSNEVEVQKFL